MEVRVGTNLELLPRLKNCVRLYKTSRNRHEVHDVKYQQCATRCRSEPFTLIGAGCDIRKRSSWFAVVWRTAHVLSLHLMCGCFIIDGLPRQPPVSTQQGPAFSCAPSTYGKTISRQNAAVLLAQRSLLKNLERPRVFFQCLLAAQLNRSSDEQRKPKYRPLHQAHSNPLSWPFAVLGHAPVYSHPLPGCCSFSLGLMMLEQRSSVTKGASKGLDVPWMRQLPCVECIFLI